MTHKRERPYTNSSTCSDLYSITLSEYDSHIYKPTISKSMSVKYKTIIWHATQALGVYRAYVEKKEIFTIKHNCITVLVLLLDWPGDFQRVLIFFDILLYHFGLSVYRRSSPDHVTSVEADFAWRTGFWQQERLYFFFCFMIAQSGFLSPARK